VRQSQEVAHVNIKVLGAGCSNCHKVKAVVREVVTELGLEDATIQEVPHPGHAGPGGG
jgi:hypothetical protein